MISEKAMEAHARRAAKRVGLVARKSQWRLNSIDNRGGFRLVDPSINCVVDSERFDLVASYVIEVCREMEAA